MSGDGTGISPPDPQRARPSTAPPPNSPARTPPQSVRNTNRVLGELWKGIRVHMEALSIWSDSGQLGCIGYKGVIFLIRDERIYELFPRLGERKRLLDRLVVADALRRLADGAVKRAPRPETQPGVVRGSTHAPRGWEASTAHAHRSARGERPSLSQLYEALRKGQEPLYGFVGRSSARLVQPPARRFTERPSKPAARG